MNEQFPVRMTSLARFAAARECGRARMRAAIDRRGGLFGQPVLDNCAG